MAGGTATGCIARGTEPTGRDRLSASLRAVLALAAVLLGLPIATLSAQEPVFLPGSSWGIVPPPGFAIEPSSRGMFYHPSGAVILVVTSTQPHDRSRFTAVGQIAGSGIDEGRVTSIEDVAVAGRPAYLMRLRMFKRQADAISMLVQGRTSGTLMALIPDAARAAIQEEVIVQARYNATQR